MANPRAASKSPIGEKASDILVIMRNRPKAFGVVVTATLLERDRV